MKLIFFSYLLSYFIWSFSPSTIINKRDNYAIP